MHGSTIAINTVIQKNGALTGLITTRGFRDVYEIGRSNRPDAYNLFFGRPQPLVPREPAHRGRRADARARPRARPLDEAEVHAAVTSLQAAGVESIAVVLLHAYANPVHEIRVGDIIARTLPGLATSRSRTKSCASSANTNARRRRCSTPTSAPIVSTLRRAHRGDAAGARASRGSFLIMQSNGGTMSCRRGEVAAGRDDGVGPGRRRDRLGTARRGARHAPTSSRSTWAARRRSRAWSTTARRASSTGYHIGGYATGHPMMLPVIDIVEVGTGGGSIAWIDAAGGLKVGPRSAGRRPGPGLLRPWRHRADGHRREPRARPARIREQVSRRRDAARRRGGARGDRERIAEPLADERRGGGARHL